MTGSQLVCWANLEESRRKASRRGLARRPTLLSVLVGVLVALEFVRRLWGQSGADLAMAARSSSHLWVALCVVSFSIGVFGAPFRLYWRRDSRILAGLPLSGHALFTLAMRRTLIATGRLALVVSPAIFPLIFLANESLGARHFVPLGVGIVGSALLGPAAAVLAGDLVASDKAQSLIASMGGEFQAPKTSWLGALPGIAATAVAVGIIALAPWLLGERPPGGSPWVAVILLSTLSVVLWMWARRRAHLSLPAIVREVAGLDQERLAHVDRSEASPIEAGVFSLLSTKARVWARKDAALLRRRYPSPYFVIPLLVVALWIVAATQPDSYLSYGMSFYGGALVYAWRMDLRSLVEPVELERLRLVLAVGQGVIAKAKTLQSVLRIGVLWTLGGLPFALRSGSATTTAIVVTVMAVLAFGASQASLRGEKK